MTPEQLERLAQLLRASGGAGGVALGERATPSTPSTPYYQGPGGLFGVAGLEREVFSTRVQPRGLASIIPARGTLITNPQFPYLTGFQADTGSEPNGVCDDPPTVGAGKSCIQTAVFGRYSRQTRTVEVNRLGQIINRGEFTDLVLVNEPLVNDQNFIGPNVPGAMNLYNDMFMRMVEIGVSFQNLLGRQLYEGNPANNTGGGGSKQFPGLDILIGTGKLDALTGTLCPSLDSDIKNFNYARVTQNNGVDILNTLTYLLRTLRVNAENMNMGEVEWVIVMRPELFYEMTAIWPCVYMTYRCVTTQGGTAIVDSGDQIRMRDDMRNGMYLMVDGIRYRVIPDTFIREETNKDGHGIASGCMASDIYVIPLRVRGNVAVTYWEYLDYRDGAVAQMAAAQLGPMFQNYFWADGGRYLWHFKPPTNWCVQLMAKIEPRLILRTPHLAGRLLNVQYCPLQHPNDPIPNDPYYKDGGVSTARAAPSLYKEW